jgi:hypothetical protein
MGSKLWTTEEEDILLESYGSTTVKTLVKRLGKSEDAIKQKMKELTGSYDMHAAGGLFTARQVAPALGVDHRTVCEWIKTMGFPAKQLNRKTKHSDKNYQYFIDPYEVWRWVSKNKERVRFAHMERGLLLPEPHWLDAEIKKDAKKGLKRPTNWTDEEDELAWFWYKGGVNYREIARRLGRPEKGTQRRLTVIRKKKESLKEIG